MSASPKIAIAETIADWLVATRAQTLPAPTVEMCRKLFLDVAGLCVSARNEDYVRACVGAAERGQCTAIGHAGGFDAFSAALINGTAAHGEDYDDTFEGGPVHSGAVIIPAVLAICEREGLGGDPRPHDQTKTVLVRPNDPAGGDHLPPRLLPEISPSFDHFSFS